MGWNQMEVFSRLGGGAAGSAAQWGHFIKDLYDRVKGRIPGTAKKNFVDNLTVVTGPNDRCVFFGPTMNSNLGPGYSTSFDVAGYLINNYAPLNCKTALKFIFGSGDIKLAFGPSTSLLYGGPGGSSKRGPYWERIAGSWWDPQGKGAKYSAEGSFTPQALGKTSTDGLQFFEKDQIFGESNLDGELLGVLVKAGKIVKHKSVVSNDPNDANKKILTITSTDGDLDDVKKDKYKSDLEKCYTKEELLVLETGDKASKICTIAILLLDLIGSTLSMVLIGKDNYAGTFSEDQLKKKVNDRLNNYKVETEKKEKEKLIAESNLKDAEQREMDKKDEVNAWVTNNPEQTANPKEWSRKKQKLEKEYADCQQETFQKRSVYEKKQEESENAKKNYTEDMPFKDTTVQRDLDFNLYFLGFRLLYRTVKVLLLTLLEFKENTERLARMVIENRDNMIEFHPTQYAKNIHLKTEKRIASNRGVTEAYAKKIDEELKERLGKSPKQIADVAALLLKGGKRKGEI
jgi:hypothetical protein